MPTVKTRMSFYNHWDKVMLLYSVLCPTQLQPLEKKEVVFCFPTHFKALTSYSKCWFCWLHTNSQEAS